MCEKESARNKQHLSTLRGYLVSRERSDALECMDSVMANGNLMLISERIANRLYQRRHDIYSAPDALEAMFEEEEDGTNCFLKQLIVDVGGVACSDKILMIKETLDFFHYARCCMEMMLRLVAVLFLEENVSAKGSIAKSIQKALQRLDDQEQGPNLHQQLIRSIDGNDYLNYIIDFDNYTKHDALIKVNVKNSAPGDPKRDYSISSFGHYPRKSVLEVMEISREAVFAFREGIAQEVLNLKDCIK